jgi:HD superfamily phosphohydrolase
MPATERLFRDPIHNIIILDLGNPGDRVLSRLIDSREFQRLRRIRQLGMASMAFHGAEHSRFTHCMGVMHLTRRLLERLSRDAQVTPRQALAVQCAALLHDIGHGPFSHVIEKFFTRHHEDWSRAIIADPGTEAHRALASYAPDFPEEVIRVLDGRVEPKWLHAMISSQLDADRFDYLLRDSHMTGVRYGVFDLERLLLMLQVDAAGEKIVVSPKAVLAVEKYLQSRYHMYRQVYFHKTVTSAEAMLMAVLDRARELAAAGALPGIDPLGPLARVLAGDDSISIPDYLGLDDSVVLGALNAWQRCGDGTLSDLSRRLLDRDLFKALEVSAGEAGDMIASARLEEARDVLRSIGLDPKYYLLSGRSADTPYKPYSTRRIESTIWIQDAEDPSRLNDVATASPTIRAFVESPYEINRVFFPARAGGVDLRARLLPILKG